MGGQAIEMSLWKLKCVELGVPHEEAQPDRLVFDGQQVAFTAPRHRLGHVVARNYVYFLFGEAGYGLAAGVEDFDVGPAARRTVEVDLEVIA